MARNTTPTRVSIRLPDGKTTTGIRHKRAGRVLTGRPRGMAAAVELPAVDPFAPRVPAAVAELPEGEGRFKAVIALTDVDALEHLARHGDPEDRRAAVASWQLTTETLTELVDDPDAYIRTQIAYSENVGSAHLRALAADVNRDVRDAVANRTDDPELLGRLAGDPESRVQHSAAANPATPGEALEHLALCSPHSARIAARMNPSLPISALDRIAASGVAGDREFAAADRRTPPEVLGRLARDSTNSVRRHLIENPAVPTAALRHLAGSKVEAIAHRASQVLSQRGAE